MWQDQTPEVGVRLPDWWEHGIFIYACTSIRMCVGKRLHTQKSHVVLGEHSCTQVKSHLLVSAPLSQFKQRNENNNQTAILTFDNCVCV